MKTCESCKHWERYDLEAMYYWSKNNKANPDDFGKCTAATFEFWQHKGDKPFYIMDGSEYTAELTTRRDFACNQHANTLGGGK